MSQGDVRRDYADALRLDARGFVLLGAGGNGIGTEVARALAALGARLLCVDRRIDEANRVAAETGGTAHAADVTSRDDMARVFARADSLFGGLFSGIVDIVGAAYMHPLADFDDAALDRQFNIVFRHAVL